MKNNLFDIINKFQDSMAKAGNNVDVIFDMKGKITITFESETNKDLSDFNKLLKNK